MKQLLVNIDVPDVRAAADFYTAALGLKLKRIIDGDTAELVGASSPIYLQLRPAGSSANPADSTRSYARHWTPLHLDFVVPDLRAATQRALQAGAKQESECIAWAGSQWISFADPFGHGFCLIQFDGDTYIED